jgi:hypothetical protein
VLDDWRFFLDNEVLRYQWASRFGPAATVALAEELRGLPWRTAQH